ncbi:MAG TPA: NYN domain-containing protein [bacterium]|nr:NYN domain-containing protein [bacterium]HPP30066.1 NYN domain-containing protein [bacterium]
MEYIIDGYNLIKSSFLSRYESRGISYSMQMLINILGDYRRRHPSVSFTVVFDGNPPFPYIFHQEKYLKVIFSGDVTADEVIRRRVEKTSEKNVSRVVVSDDRGVKDAGRLFGARVLSISVFLDIVSPSGKKKVSMRNEKRAVNELRIEKELRRHYRM